MACGTLGVDYRGCSCFRPPPGTLAEPATQLAAEQAAFVALRLLAERTQYDVGGCRRARGSVTEPARPRKAAKSILAINTDAEAPIVTKATYAVIGDVREVLRAINSELRKALGRQETSTT